MGTPSLTQFRRPSLPDSARSIKDSEKPSMSLCAHRSASAIRLSNNLSLMLMRQPSMLTAELKLHTQVDFQLTPKADTTSCGVTSRTLMSSLPTPNASPQAPQELTPLARTPLSN